MKQPVQIKRKRTGLRIPGRLRMPVEQAWRELWFQCALRFGDHDRSLPDFAIVGCQRCGTTSLFRYLARHPLILPSIKKEVHYFDREENFARGEYWYRAHFPARKRLARAQRRSGQRVLTGEATPDYLFREAALERMARLWSPETRLIVLLRNPVDRAYSQYQNALRKGQISTSFEMYVATELAVHFPESGVKRPPSPQPKFSFLRRGIYIDQLRALDRYLPSNPKLVLISEEFFVEPAKFLDQVLAFLGLPSAHLGSLHPHNELRYSAALAPALRQQLTEFFGPYNRSLSEYLGRDLGWS